MNLLALDLGFSCGWAMSTASGVESGTQVFTVDRGESPGMRYLRFRRWLEELVGEPPRVQVVTWEAAHQQGGYATQAAYGLITRVIELAAVRGIETMKPVHSLTLKKFASGYGRADKPTMRAAAIAKGWLDPSKPDVTDDEVDALCVLAWAREQMEGKT